jgi:FkbM family methyltransferase
LISSGAGVTKRNPLLRWARHRIGSTGLNRSMIMRRLSQVGHPRLRELRARGLAGGRPADRMLGHLIRFVESGVVTIPSGYANELKLDMSTLPISHAHFGSLTYGNLESAVQEAMLRHLAAGGVFYDVGANLGFFALLGARLAGPEGTVVAFEAAPDNAEAIRVNAALNGFTNIEVIAKAVSDRSGVGQLQVVDDQSWSKLAEYGEHPNTEKVMDVELVSIDQLIADGAIRPPTVVKIDVEGAELAVLEGMRSTIAAYQPAIICELHDTHAEFVEFARSCGYRLINLEGTIPVQAEGASAHALALPALNSGD